METWKTILLALGGNAALLAVLGIAGKSLLDKLILRDTKQFENDLQAKSDAAIERLKNELQVRTIEHQVRFSRLHEKRASVIAELNGYLVEALWEAESFLSPMEWAGEPNKKEKHQQAINKLVELYRYFDKHRIYLPHEVCTSLEAIVQNVRLHVTKFGIWVRYENHQLTDDSHAKKNDAWDSGWTAIRNEVPVARKILENEFRALLGAAANVSVERDATQATSPLTPRPSP
jgi:hypothetical protein